MTLRTACTRANRPLRADGLRERSPNVLQTIATSAWGIFGHGAISELSPLGAQKADMASFAWENCFFVIER